MTAATPSDIIEAEDPSLLDGTYRLTLSISTQKSIECVVGQDLHPLRTMKLVDMAIIRKELDKSESDFNPIRNCIQKSNLKEALVIWQCGEELLQDSLDTSNTKWYDGDEACFLICINKDSKMGYLQREEDYRTNFNSLVCLKGLIDRTTLFENQLEISPRPYKSRGSEQDIAATTVVASRAKIRLQVTHSHDSTLRLRSTRFSDALPSTLSLPPFDSSLKLKKVQSMDKATQAVADLSTKATQTILRQPRQQCVQYEPRIMNEKQLEKVLESQGMKSFIDRAERIVTEVRSSPDIMGWLRPNVSLFYRRNEPNVVIETNPRVRHVLFELNLTRNHRVHSIAFHPRLQHLIAMSIREKGDYDTQYLAKLSERLAKPKVVLLWSLVHPQYPQLLLRPPDDVEKIVWHPGISEVLVAGCHNGQICVWDICKSVMDKLEKNECLYRTKSLIKALTGVNVDQTESDEFGYCKSNDAFDLVKWSVESNAELSHRSPIRNIHFLPSVVTFSADSAYPKLRPESESDASLQLMTCDADNYVLVWALTERDASAVPASSSSLKPLLFSTTPKLGSTLFGWDRLRSFRSAQNTNIDESRYSHLDRVWQPIHRIRFWDPKAKVTESELFKTLITSIFVVAKPELLSSTNVSRRSSHAVINIDTNKDDDSSNINEKRKYSNASSSILSSSNLESNQMALPTFLLAGTMLGELFRVDMTRVKVDVETNDLICKVEWMHATHDGPVSQIEVSPLLPQLIASVGGTGFALWRDGHNREPLIVHSTSTSLLSRISWSQLQPHILFATLASGQLEIWDIRSQNLRPIQSHDVSGRTLTELNVCFNVHENSTQKVEDSEEGRRYVCVGDDEGNLFLLELPIQFRTQNKDRLTEVVSFMEECERRHTEQRRVREERMDTDPKEKILDKEQKVEHVEEAQRDQILALYFARERNLMKKMLGEHKWMMAVKHQNWPRAEFAQLEDEEEERRLSSGERKRRAELEAAKARKRLGRSIYRKYSDDG